MSEPDPSQQRVVDAPVSARLLVEAPPGAGKTWTASQRLVSLAAQPHRDDDEDATLLALSFSRAAALAITTELYRSGIGSRVEVRTIDSWCSTMLIASGASDDEMFGRDFDERIDMLLGSVSNGTIEFRAYRHVVVDEAQDVIGPRARLLGALLASDSTTGWTVLGDPAQTIYDFSGDGPTLFDMIAWTGATRTPLEGSHRTRSRELVAIVDLGKGLRTEAPSAEALSEVRSAHMCLRKLGQRDLGRVAPTYAEGPDSTAILVRDNRIALAIAEELAVVALPFEFVAARAEGLLPAWLTALSVPDRPWLEEEDILAAIPAGIDSSPITRAVRVLGGLVGERAGLDRLADALLARRAPEPLLQLPRTPLLISTIHRAKGLEFDRVLVGLAEGARDADVDEVAESRVLYVAMTRAKSTLFRLCLDGPRVWRRDKRSGRMVDLKYVGGHRQIPIGLELRPGDIDLLRPWASVADRVPQLSGVTMGTPVMLRLLPESADEVPVFEVVADPVGTIIGHTRLALGSALVDLGWERPGQLVGGRVMGMQTVVVPRGAVQARVRLVAGPVVRGMLTRDGGTEHDR